MGQLFFKKAMQLAIREGCKRTTIRRWDRPRLKAGGRAYSPGLGWLEVEAVEAVDLASLDDDAKADGFDTAERLRRALLDLYPEHAADGKLWFRVRFTVAASEPPRGGADTGAEAREATLFDLTELDHPPA